MLLLDHKITNRLDLCRADAAAASDETRPAADPVMDFAGSERCRTYPALGCGVPALTAIGIDHGRFACGKACAAQQGVCVGWVDAVDTDCDDFIDVSGECKSLIRRLAGTGTVSGTSER